MNVGLALIAIASLLRAQDEPVERTDRNSQAAHEQLLAKKTLGRIDVYFEGDSITRRWGATDYPELLENWKKNFFGWNAADFGWGADRVENMLWRLQHGELDGVDPKAIVLLAGTNNVGARVPAENVSQGIAAVLRVMERKAPNAQIILMGIFPRNDDMAMMPEIDSINASLAKMADGRRIRYLNINSKLADSSGKLYDGMTNPKDKLHPTARGYQVWADALKPLLTEILGPPAAEDHGPPPTGDPGLK
jgi:lysophospholipase L1-like esterase